MARIVRALTGPRLRAGAIAVVAIAIATTASAPATAALPVSARDVAAVSRAGTVPADGVLAPRAHALSWSPCEDDDAAQCATLVVPQNWKHPGAKTFRLAVRKLPALSPVPGRKARTLFINPGGPGVSGTGFLTYFEGNKALREKFDLVSWDPRGVEESSPLPQDCPQPQLGGWSPLTGDFTWTGIARQALALRAESAKACIAANAAIARRVGTRDVARDLDALRRAVGSSKLTYLGYSYGTTVGRVYAQMFPGKVRAMILDGVTSPVTTFDDLITSSRIGAEAGWAMMVAGLPSGIEDVSKRVSEYLQNHTAVSDSESLDRWKYWSSLINSARFSNSSKVLAGRICIAAEQVNLAAPACDALASGAPVSQTAREAPADGSPIVQLVDCADRSGRPSGAKIGNSLAANGVSPEVASNVLYFASLCGGMPPASHPLKTLTKLKLAHPPLLINGIGDIATPLYSARRTAKAFPGSRLVSVRTTTHGLFALHGDANSCVNAAGLRYLVTGVLPRRNVTCSSV